MFEAGSTRLGNVASKGALLTAGVLAAGLGAGLAAAPAARADLITNHFQQSSDFNNHFTVVAAEAPDSFFVANHRLNLSDGATSGTDGGYAVVQQSGGSTTFDASQLSVSVEVGNRGSNPGGHGRRYGPTLFGAQDRSATLQAGALAGGSALAIGLVPNIQQGTPGNASNFNTIASMSITGGSGDVSGRVVFTADNINAATHTADLTAQYFDNSAPSTAAATVTVPDYDLAANGLSTVGEVGLARTGGRNKRATFDNFRLEYTPGALVPEPASLALLGLGGLALLGRRRRGRR